MKAIVMHEKGDVSKLMMENVPMPTIEDDDVLIKVMATSVNAIDWKMMLLSEEFPLFLGRDVAGIVEKVGSNVIAFKQGDRVVGKPGEGSNGSFAEYIDFKGPLLTHLPDTIDFETAAGVPTTGLTAWRIIHGKLNVQEGQTVLVNGGAGGVGMFAVQIIHNLGARVIVTAQDVNADWLTEIGAAEVIDYTKQEFPEVVKNVDSVFDTVGGESLEKSFRVVKPNGYLASSADPINVTEAIMDSVNFDNSHLLMSVEDLRNLIFLLRVGTLKVIKDSVHSFTERGVRDAIKIGQSHHAKGKIIINME